MSIQEHDLQPLLRHLEKHPDYRVLRRLPIRKCYQESGCDGLARGAIVDLETTGTNIAVDKLIELGILVFEFDPLSGQVYGIVGEYESLEDPGIPIPAEATAINGISMVDVAGKRIDEPSVVHLMKSVSLVIAHNAAFDRPILEERLPIFAGMPWACSYRELDWAAAGISSPKLDYIAYRQGFFFEGHRAVADCRALLECLQRPLDGMKGLPLRGLVESASRRSVRIFALGSPFESKDVLKARGYIWNADRRVWHVTVREEAIQDEIAWLKSAVYRKSMIRIEVEVQDASNRYSLRRGTATIHQM